MWRPSKRQVVWLLALAGLTVAVGALAVASGWAAMGARASGARLERMRASAQWRDGRFENTLARHDGSYWRMTWEWISGGSEVRVPDRPVRVEQPAHGRFARFPASGLRVTWLGHSTLLVELDGERVLVDPVWGDRASPFTWAGPKRFYPPPLPLERLPAIGAIVISHDHYDHLDHPTIRRLAASSRAPFLVPLGVGAHLEYWGVPTDRIVELDWWQEHRVGALTFVATPARHFSGRSVFLSDQQQTLWAGWAVIGPEHRVFYSGDTAMFPAFSDIGERLGPFDATMIEAGAYDDLWADVHLGPEQAVMAHRMVRGDLLIPVHWGLFDLALHGWTEPVERVLAAGKASGARIATPAPGGSIEPGAAERTALRWWPELPWKTVEDEPAFSSGLDEKRLARWAAPGWLPLLGAKRP